MCVIAALAVSLAPSAANAVTSESQGDVADRVFAQLETANDPQQELKSISSDERYAFEQHYLPASESTTFTITSFTDEDGKVANSLGATEYESESEAVSALAAAGCGIGESRVVTKSAIGLALFDTYTEGKFCTNGSSITSTQFLRSWSYVGMVGWRDAGLISSGHGVGGNQGRAWSQRKYILGSAGVDVDQVNKCSRVSMSVNGNFASKATCSRL